MAIGLGRRSFIAFGLGFMLVFGCSPTLAVDQQIPVQVSVGDSVTLQLDGNPSTGYSWVLVGTPKIVAVDLLGYAKRELAPGERPVLGAPQKMQVLVTGVTPGSASLVFHYVKAGAAPAKTQEYAVEVVGDAPSAQPQEDAADPSRDEMKDPGERMFDGTTGDQE
ncbi:protease inhibitor I42 family protein [Hyphomicrobium sp.]|uniref:protease inhibitor I42 family protein n=1 Tax=Hyphomicrobium sp. TaxID=82 RepID=UPI002E30FF4E|nr:protease inhibitor I42 family protein [Hyphomicrobium sp.]HEX2842453.1 protease inhibitor I42 family protein [Hyphomicrobium sp.]